MNIVSCFYLINNKKINSRELSKFIIKKIESSLNKNYVINIKYETIIKQSIYSDFLVDKKLNKVLTGIPFIYKDIYSWKLLKTTGGSRLLKNYLCVYNSTCAGRLKNIGVVNFGKSNMDEFGVGSNNFNYYYGKPQNNTNSWISCGGSSGGTYIVSKGIIPVTIVSDTGGSARQPALLNGLIGFKPSYGRVSRNGMLPYSPTMDTVGIISNNIINMAITLNAISGFDVKDPTSLNLKREDFTRYINKNWLPYFKNYSNKILDGLTVGISKNFLEDITDYNIKSNTEWVLSIFEFLGANIKFIYIKSYKFLYYLYNTISSIELFSSLSRYNSFMYNYNTCNYSYRNKYNNFYFFNNTIKKKLLLSDYILTNEKLWKKLIFCKKLRRLVLEDLRKVFKICKIILIPNVHNSILKNSYNIECRILFEFYNYIVNIAGLPAININTGFQIFNGLKLPLGVQIICNYFQEAKLFQVSNIFINFKCY